MKLLLHLAMREGAMGMSAALIYPPATYQSTAELIELCRVVAEYDGMYITHLRSEGATFHEALDELLEIMRDDRRHRRDLPPQGVRVDELAQDGRGDRQGRSGAGWRVCH